eukprot:352020-Chlamydomonas_euryale.AAC.11
MSRLAMIRKGNGVSAKRSYCATVLRWPAQAVTPEHCDAARVAMRMRQATSAGAPAWPQTSAG